MQDTGVFCFRGCSEAHAMHRLGKGCCNNPMYNKPASWSFMTDGAFSAPSSQVTGWRHREWLPDPVPPSSPSQQPPALIPVTTSPCLEIFSPWPQAPGSLRKGISQWFLHCSLWKSYITSAIGKCLHHLAFVLVSLNTDSKITLISIPNKHIVASLLVRHRLWISLLWKLQNTALVSVTSFKGAPGVLNEKFI